MPIKFDWADVMFMAATVYGEARGESYKGRLAVAHVILNRARKGGWWGDNIISVVTKRWQFSCWNEANVNSAYVKNIAHSWDDDDLSLMDNHDVQAAVQVSLAALLDIGLDPSQGSCHYARTDIEAPWYDESKIVATIGNHHFFRGIT